MSTVTISAFSFIFMATLLVAEDYHISAIGDDRSGNGSAEQPFATPARVALALAGRSAAARAEPSTVIVHAGRYPIRDSVTLTAAHSGSKLAQVIWRAAGDGKVEFSGGVTVPAAALHEVRDAITLARLPGDRPPGLRLYEIRLADLGLVRFPTLNPRGFGRGSAAAWPELFCDGIPLPLAGFPNGEGFAHGFKPAKIVSAGTNAKVTAGGAAATANTVAATPMVFIVPTAKRDLWKSALQTHHAAIWFGGHWFWDWADDFIPAASIDDMGAVTMGMRHPYGIGRHVNLRAFNLAEEMDAPGEYALEPASQRILVLLAPGDARKTLSLTWTGSPLFTIDGATYLRFENLAFDHGRHNAVAIKNGACIAFSNCSFTRFGDYAARVSGRRVIFNDCTFTCLGAGAVHLSGGDRKSLTHAGHEVNRCRIEDFSRLTRTYAPGISLNGVGSTISHCLFARAPHSAILFNGNEHTIAENEIHSVLTETGDCGAIYGGRDWAAHGTVIRGNWIHNLGGVAGRWACGIYLDDQLSGITVKNNWVDHAELGILVGGGRHNLIEGNLFSNCKSGMHVDARGMTWGKTRLLPTLKKRLAEIPVDQEPWKSRYPMLARTLADRPDRAVGTRVTGNAIVACKKPWLNRADGGVAVLAPNFENLPASAMESHGREVIVKGTPLRITKPPTGPTP